MCTQLEQSTADVTVDDAVIQASQMRQLDKPDKYDVQLVRDWTFHSDGGDGFPDLETPGEQLPWGTVEQPKDDDLLCLKGRGGDQDIFTRWLAGTFLDRFNDWLQKRKFWQRYLENANKQQKPSDAFFRMSFQLTRFVSLLTIEKDLGSSTKTLAWWIGPKQRS